MRRVWLLMLACLLPPQRGEAREVWASEDGASALEVRAFYKSFGAALRMQPGLVDGTVALQRLVDELREQVPAELPTDLALPAYGATSTHVARVWGRLLFLRKFELSAGWQLGAAVASSPAFLGGGGLGGGALAGSASGAGAQRRLVDFDGVLGRSGGLLLQHDLGVLSLKASLPIGEVVVGRQILSWGTGRFWNPTDLLSPFAPTDLDREVRRGVDAVRVSLPLGRTGLLDMLWLPQQEGWAQGGVLRAQANLAGFDVSVSAAKYVGDLVFGADTSGDLGPLGVHAELAYTLGFVGWDGSRELALDEHFLRAVAGLEWKPLEDLVLMAEYHFNGFGAESAREYALKLSSDRVGRGEVFGAGRHYLGLGAVWSATELLSVQATVIANLADPSAIVVPSLEYWAEQSVLLRLGGYVPIGKGPDPRGLQALTTTDLLTASPAYLDATSSLGLRSEYGASPWGLFVQVGLYF